MENDVPASKKRIFISPLDWGLGHASRLVPLISNLKIQGHFILLGTGDKTRAFLKEVFPDLPQVVLKDYGIRYPSQNKMHWKLMIQIPRLVSAIIREHISLRKIVRIYKIDTVISDSRFGLRNKKTQNFILSHQLQIIYPSGLAFFGKILNRINRTLINGFDVCLIPDDESHTYSGILSQNSTIRNQRFIGPQSRFAILNKSASFTQKDLVFVFSGPEPQRTILEQIVIDQLKATSFSALLISGQPQKSYSYQIGPNIDKVSHLPDPEFASTLKNAQIVFSRSGYSSIMDYAALGLKQIVLIPTPGQTEQEYLAEKFYKSNHCLVCTQENFNLPEAIENVKSFHGFKANEDFLRNADPFLY